MIDKYKNWKSSTAFFLFIAAFLYSVGIRDVQLAEVTGFVALVSWSLVKASSNTFNTAVVNLTEAIKNKWSKK